MSALPPANRRGRPGCAPDRYPLNALAAAVGRSRAWVWRQLTPELRVELDVRLERVGNSRGLTTVDAAAGKRWVGRLLAERVNG